MAKSKELIPDFMMDSPDDSFMFLMPTGFKPDLVEDIGNSSLNVIVKNLTKKAVFKTQITPELFYTKFKLHQAYRNGKMDRTYKYLHWRTREKFIAEASYPVNSNINERKLYDAPLKSVLPEKFIGQLLGWNKEFIKEASETSCYFIPGNLNIIIPHYAIACYYYFRSSLLREAVLRCNIEDLYYQCECGRDASIVIPKYVKEEIAPFIHRFVCQPDASSAFESMGKYLFAYMDRHKNDKNEELQEHLPLKAKFPVKSQFKIWTRHTFFYDEESRKHFIYIHEITNDDSDIGFDKLTTYYPGSNVIPDEKQSLEDISAIPLKDPLETTSRLNAISGSKRYIHNTMTFKHNKSCKSLENVERLTAKLNATEMLQKLYIVDEISTDETVDQSATASHEGEDELVRKCRISALGEELIRKSREHTENFLVFRQYIEYMEKQLDIVDLCVCDALQVPTVMGTDNKPKQKCFIKGRERKYITVTFTYKGKYFGLLELENISASSTWVVTSNQPLKNDIFSDLLKLHVDNDESVNKIKEAYDKNDLINFRKKNHKFLKKIDDETKARDDLSDSEIFGWLVGILGRH